MPTLTDEQREAIREKRREIGNVSPRGEDRRTRRIKRKQLKAAAAAAGCGRKTKQITNRAAKPMSREYAKHFGVTWSLEPGDLAVLCKDTWLRTAGDSNRMRRTLPKGTLVVIDGRYDYDVTNRGTVSDWTRNKCTIFFDGVIWEYCPMANLRPLADYDDDEEDED